MHAIGLGLIHSSIWRYGSVNLTGNRQINNTVFALKFLCSLYSSNLALPVRVFSTWTPLSPASSHCNHFLPVWFSALYLSFPTEARLFFHFGKRLTHIICSAFQSKLIVFIDWPRLPRSKSFPLTIMCTLSFMGNISKNIQSGSNSIFLETILICISCKVDNYYFHFMGEEGYTELARGHKVNKL